MSGYLTLAIHEVVWLMDLAADDILRQHLGIDFQKARVLMVLRNEQPISQRRLGDCLGLTPSAITRALPPFVEERLVQVQTDPKQPRRNLLELTEEGRKLADACWNLLEAEFDKLLSESKVDPARFLGEIEAIRSLLSSKGGKK